MFFSCNVEKLVGAWGRRLSLNQENLCCPQGIINGEAPFLLKVLADFPFICYFHWLHVLMAQHCVGFPHEGMLLGNSGGHWDFKQGGLSFEWELTCFTFAQTAPNTVMASAYIIPQDLSLALTVYGSAND